MLPAFILRQVAGQTSGSGRGTNIVCPWLLLSVLYSPCTSDEWRGHRLLGVPKISADNCNAEIILTGLHWRGNFNASANDVRLITTYRHHGIQ